MKFFMNQSIWKKVVIALLIVLLFNAVIMKPVHADAVEFAGKLMSPILSLFVGLGDAILDIIGSTIMGATTSLYQVEMTESWFEILTTALVALAAAALVVIAIVATMGLAAVALAAVTSITATVTIGMGTVIAAASGAVIAGVWFNDEVLPDDLYLPMYTYSAEEIFKNNILLFDVNFFEKAPEILEHKDGEGKVDYYYYKNEKGEEIKTSNQSSSTMLTNTISSWYNALRNICLVLMLSVLVYIGIRILLSSVASDKAKYLTMLKDWFIGLCLLFLMHYIMAFSVTLVEKLTEIVKTAVDSNAYTVSMEATDKLKTAVRDDLNQGDAIQTDPASGIEFVVWPTNLMGSLRLQLQMESYGAKYVGLAICFLVLCLFTLNFTITYVKRLLYMAFLTLIAPMVACTYCIDKLNDGQAQGFNKWFKEYIFNLLIQPMHLLLYYILVSSAFRLASTNTIYSLAALGFMVPAEKLLRSLFSFEKAQTPPGMGTAGAMLASSALTHFMHKNSKGNGEGKNKGVDENDSENVPMPRDEVDPIQAFLNQGGEQENNGNNEEAGGLDDNGQAWQDYIDNQEEGNLENNSQTPLGGNTGAPVEQELGDNRQPSSTGKDNQEKNNLQQGQPRELDDSGLRWQAYAEDEENFMPTGSSSNNSQSKEENVSPQRKWIFTGAGGRIQRMAAASVAAQKASMRNLPRKIKERIENSHPMKFLAKNLAGAIGGGALGALKVAESLSEGDEIEDVIKEGSIAGIGGYVAASGSVNKIKGPMQDETVHQAHDNTKVNGKFEQEAMNDYVKRFRKDPKVRAYLEATCGKDAKEMLQEKGEVEQYLNNNITDVKEMEALHRLKKEGVVRNVDEAIGISKLGAMIGKSPEKMTGENQDKWKATIANLAGKGGVKDEDKEKFAEEKFKQIQKLYEFKK